MSGKWKSDSYQVYVKYTNEDTAKMQQQLVSQKVVNNKLVYINGDVSPKHISKI